MEQLYKGAKNIVARDGEISVAVLRRELGIGYARATELIDRLVSDGHVERRGRAWVVPEGN